MTVLPPCGVAFPEVDERDSRGLLQWRVRDKLFVSERPLGKPDRVALGDRAPAGPVLGAIVADLDEKDSLLAGRGSSCFTTPHFDGYAAVLVDLEAISVGALAPILVEAWLARAPARLVKVHFC